MYPLMMLEVMRELKVSNEGKCSGDTNPKNALGTRIQWRNAEIAERVKSRKITTGLSWLRPLRTTTPKFLSRIIRLTRTKSSLSQHLPQDRIFHRATWVRVKQFYFDKTSCVPDHWYARKRHVWFALPWGVISSINLREFTVFFSKICQKSQVVAISIVISQKNYCMYICSPANHRLAGRIVWRLQALSIFSEASLVSANYFARPFHKS